MRSSGGTEITIQALTLLQRREYGVASQKFSIRGEKLVRTRKGDAAGAKPAKNARAKRSKTLFAKKADRDRLATAAVLQGSRDALWS